MQVKVVSKRANESPTKPCDETAILVLASGNMYVVVDSCGPEGASVAHRDDAKI
jgi:hypothetical protein